MFQQCQQFKPCQQTVNSGNSVNSVSSAYSAVLSLSLMELFFLDPGPIIVIQGCRKVGKWFWGFCSFKMKQELSLCHRIVLIRFLSFEWFEQNSNDIKVSALQMLEHIGGIFGEKWLKLLLYILYFNFCIVPGGRCFTSANMLFCKQCKGHHHKLVKISCKAESLYYLILKYLRNCWEAARHADRSRFES